MRQESGVEYKSAALAAGFLVIILYGSLYPFEFFRNPQPGGPVYNLLVTWHSPSGLGELIANTMLYVPFGFFLVQCLRRLPLSARVAAITLAGLALCTSMELLQFYDRSRAQEMTDIYSNTAGAFLGALAGSYQPRRVRLPVVGWMHWRPFALLMAACWLGHRLFPYLPSFDVHKYRSAVESLFGGPEFSWLAFLQQTAAWLALAALLETVFESSRGRLALLLLVPAVLGARIAIVEASLSREEVAGGIFAAALWALLLWRMRMRTVLVLIVFLGAIISQALEPFKLSATPVAFGLIPFRSAIVASRETVTSVMLLKTFNYGALIWLMMRTGYSWLAAAVFGTALILFLRIAQVYLPGRSAEITDAVMVVILAAMMKLMDGAPEPQVS
jgi:glycopeptide antibiotics resistance protein